MAMLVECFEDRVPGALHLSDAGSASLEPVALLSTPLARSIGAERTRHVLSGMVSRRRVVGEIAEIFGCAEDDVNDALVYYGLPSARNGRWGFGASSTRWSSEEVRSLIQWYYSDMRIRPISLDRGRTENSCYVKLRLLGISRRDKSNLRDAPPPLPLDSFAAPVEAVAPTSAALTPAAMWDDLPVEAASAQSIPVMPSMADLPEMFGDWTDALPAEIPQPEPVPLPVVVAKAARKVRVPIPEECRGYQAPADNAAFDRFIARMVPNLLASIDYRIHRRFPSGDKRDEATQTIFALLLTWAHGHMKEDVERCRLTGETPPERWASYRPESGVEYYKWIAKQIEFQVKEFWKIQTRRDEDQSALSHFESDAEFEMAIHVPARLADMKARGEEIGGDDLTSAATARAVDIDQKDPEEKTRKVKVATYTAFMEPAAPDEVMDVRMLEQTIQRISDHALRFPAPETREARSFGILLSGLRQGRNTKEMLPDLSRVMEKPLGLPDAQELQQKLVMAAAIVREQGPKAALDHFGAC